MASSARWCFLAALIAIVARADECLDEHANADGFNLQCAVINDQGGRLAGRRAQGGADER